MRQFASDLAAGAGIGAAIAWAFATLLQVPMVVALCAAGVAFLRVFCSLRRKHSGAQFSLAPFEPAHFAFEPGGLLELDAIAASIVSEAAPEPVPATLPTVKQMQASIQRRLNVQDTESSDAWPDGSEHNGSADAADELRAAIRDLRRSIG